MSPVGADCLVKLWPLDVGGHVGVSITLGRCADATVLASLCVCVPFTVRTERREQEADRSQKRVRLITGRPLAPVTWSLPREYFLKMSQKKSKLWRSTPPTILGETGTWNDGTFPAVHGFEVTSGAKKTCRYTGIFFELIDNRQSRRSKIRIDKKNTFFFL